jgi:hypothetical protein
VESPEKSGWFIQSLMWDVRRHHMYSHWQAAWRSACGVGIPFLAYALVRLWPEPPEIVGLQGSIVTWALLTAFCAAAIFIAIVAVSFRCGFYLSRVEEVRLSTVVAVSAIYTAILVLLTSIPVATSAVSMDMPTTHVQAAESFFMINLGPIWFVVVALLVTPFAVSYVVARLLRTRASVA